MFINCSTYSENNRKIQSIPLSILNMVWSILFFCLMSGSNQVSMSSIWFLIKKSYFICLLDDPHTDREICFLLKSIYQVSSLNWSQQVLGIWSGTRPIPCWIIRWPTFEQGNMFFLPKSIHPVPERQLCFDDVDDKCFFFCLYKAVTINCRHFGRGKRNKNQKYRPTQLAFLARWVP